MIEKRKNPTMTEQEMYKISDINNFIESEQRKDELDRLYEVKEQKKVWNIVVKIAELIIVVLLILAYMGYKNNG